MEFSERGRATLQDHGYKITRQRVKILQILATVPRPLNAYEIAELAGRRGVFIDISTVYRVLRIFEQLHLVHFVQGARGYIACQESLCADSTYCHHQFVCTKCRAVKELHVDDRQFLALLKTQCSTYDITDHYFEFTGLCETCTTS